MSDAHLQDPARPITVTPDPDAAACALDPASAFRVKRDARINITNGGHVAVEGFLLDLSGETVTAQRAAEMRVWGMHILRAGAVTITRMEVMPHGAHDEAASPMADARGRCDATPGGDAPGFVRVLDDVTLAMLDRLGDNRVDTLLNVASDPRPRLVFMIPGVRETLCVSGRSVGSTDMRLRESLAERGKPPASVLVINMEDLFFHGGKALIRSDLWNPEKHLAPRIIPPIGRMVAEQVGGIDPAEAEADTLAAYVERLC
jgi:predicted pyridoxine 5'-phosphate oxidase superfamily flavin-nucleotide-binding protein